MKKIFVYFLVLQITLLPTFRVWAFAPAVAVAFNSAVTSQIVRFVAGEVALEVITRGFAANDPLYASTGKLSKAKYLSFLKGKGKLVPFIASGLAAAGFLIVGDEILTNPEVTPTPEGDVSPEKGFYWRLANYVASTPLQVANMDCASFSSSSVSCVGVLPVSMTSNSAEYRRQLSNGQTSIASIYVSRSSCSSSSSSVPTCQPDYEPENPSQRPATDKEIETDFYAWVSSQPEHDQKFAFSDANGNLHPDLKPDIQVPPPPTMPDGSPIPGVGHQLWVYADWIARGVAQSSDASAPYYVPASAWDNAFYLANTVSQGNQTITNANATGSSLPEPDKPTDPDTGVTPDPNTVYKVEVTNLEQPLTSEQLEASYNGAADSLSDSVNEMNDWTDEYFSQSEDTLKTMLDSSLPDTWFTNIFAFAPTGTGQCVGWQANLEIFTPDRNYSNSVMFDAHCESYDAYIRPIVEYSLWMFTLIFVYRIGVKTLRAAP